MRYTEPKLNHWNMIKHYSTSVSLRPSAMWLVLFSLALRGSAHMTMRTPMPYGQKSLNNSPLNSDGSDFPCKQRPGVYDQEGVSNVLMIGDPQILSLTGSAVHGGGSCQVSLSTDVHPTRDSSWVVIKSIEGGCPANVTGNLPSDPQATVATNFSYTIPESILPGQYTIAWTWLNKVGNREFYMNCGPVVVQAPQKQRRVANVQDRSLPPMFVANIASINRCVAPSGYDYHYPNPGDDVDIMGAGPYIDLDCDDADEAFGSRHGNQSSTIASGQTSATTSTPRMQDNTTVTLSTGISTPTLTMGDRFTNVGRISPAIFEGPCPAEAVWACASDGESFHRCASGVWSANMALSAGTSCIPGVSSYLNLTAGDGKRRHLVGRSHRSSPFLH